LLTVYDYLAPYRADLNDMPTFGAVLGRRENLPTGTREHVVVCAFGRLRRRDKAQH